MNLEIALKVFNDHYKELKEKDIIACVNFDFLVNLLEYIKNTYHIRTDENVKNNYEMFKVLLQGLEQESITGIFHSVKQGMVNVKNYKLSEKDFEHFLSLITNFITEDKDKTRYFIEKPHFYNYDKKRYELSNTSLKSFIERVQKEEELQKYIPCPCSTRPCSTRPGSTRPHIKKRRL